MKFLVEIDHPKTGRPLSAAGFDAVDGGSLGESWRQQPNTRAYCTELAADELKAALTAADRSRAPKQRDSIMKELTSRGNQLTTDEVVRLNRIMGA
jgi:hypothetical protein